MAPSEVFQPPKEWHAPWRSTAAAVAHLRHDGDVYVDKMAKANRAKKGIQNEKTVMLTRIRHTGECCC